MVNTKAIIDRYLLITEEYDYGKDLPLCRLMEMLTTINEPPQDFEPVLYLIQTVLNTSSVAKYTVVFAFSSLK